MKYVFLSNYLSHHQIPFSEAMLTNEEYQFIAADKISENRKKLGYREYSEATIPYLIEIGENEDKRRFVRELATQADVAIIGAADFSLVEPRIEQGKLTFICSERIFKKQINIVKLLLRGILIQRFIKPGKRGNVFLLSASAYLPNDLHPFGIFMNRAYRWGYFPRTQADSFQQIMQEKEHAILQILWVGRLIPYKRPQYALFLAKMLKEQGYDFHLNIIGNGILGKKMQEVIEADHLEDVVTMAGAMSPEDVRKAMNRADIFVYTANRQEGWGAVLNEAMNSACAVVCCREIGSAPYLIKEGVNGLIFDHANKTQMVVKVKELMDDSAKRLALSEQAYRTITEVWNAEEAARRLKILCKSLLDIGDCNIFTDGPCSKATVTISGDRLIR